VNSIETVKSLCQYVLVFTGWKRTTAKYSNSRRINATVLQLIADSLESFMTVVQFVGHPNINNCLGVNK
jgi:hypothetical protein